MTTFGLIKALLSQADPMRNLVQIQNPRNIDVIEDGDIER
jgi:hypothetical protein